MKKVYQIPQKIRRLPEVRERKSIPYSNIVMTAFMMFLLQYESFHTVYSAPESMRRRLKHVVKGRIPKVDAVREALSRTKANEIQKIHESVIDRIRRNRVMQQKGNTIGGYVVAAIDGLELFSSRKKKCVGCLTRKRGEETEYFHRSVVCASIGGKVHVVYGQEMLKPRDGAEKDEGELTGGKRLIERLWKRFHHFADVIVADALYLNAPFINTVLGCGMDVVIRLKDEKRVIFQDAERRFSRGEGKGKSFEKNKVNVEVWDHAELKMNGVERPVRVVKYRETRYTGKAKKEEIRHVWLVTTLLRVDPQVLWEMMHRRWDIEENAFHQLKTYYHAKHCYCHGAVEVLFNLMLIAFNIRELYLFCRTKTCDNRKVTRKSITRLFRGNLLEEDFSILLYYDTA